MSKTKLRLREYEVWVSDRRVMISRHRDPEGSPSEIWQSRMRIRQIAVDLFRRYFGGREPKFSWGKDGFMAEATDLNRGFVVEVYQRNGKWSVQKQQTPILIKESA